MAKHIGAYVTIFSLATVLTLATASECSSITHLPSLLYGAMLWGWWALIASGLWKRGKQTDFLTSLSLRAVLVQLLTGTGLGILHLLLMSTLGASLLNLNRLGLEAGWQQEFHAAGVDQAVIPTRISYFALLATTTWSALRKVSHRRCRPAEV